MRHLIGIIDPFWILTLALDLGLVVGLYVLGAGSFWIGFIAVLLLVIANYLLARVIEHGHRSPDAAASPARPC